VNSSPGKSPSASVAPRVSIVVPTFARRAALARCLDGLAALDRTVPFEVVVVDDGGPEPLDALVAARGAQLDVQLIRQPRGGPAAARNAGAARARGAWLAFIDDDCTPDPGWLAAIVRELERDDRRLLGGRVENALPGNPYASASEHIAAFVYDHNRTAHAREPFFRTNNIAVAAELFHDVGGFLTAIPSGTAEDKEFCDRWSAHGLPLAHVPSAVVRHAHDLTFTRFLRLHFAYGRGILAFRLIRRERCAGPYVPEPARFYLDLVLSPLRRPKVGGRLRLSALLVVAQLATAAGALREVLSRPFPAPPRAGRRRSLGA
jgi:glycosyltransferase involved in cell wall biosynthesis